MKRILPLLLLVLLLAGCAAARPEATPAPTPEPTAAPTPEPTPEATPEPTPAPLLAFPNGVTVPADADSVDLRALTHEQTPEALRLLPDMTALRRVYLGEEREGGPDWADIRALEQAAPGAYFFYSFSLYGVPLTLGSTRVDLNHIHIRDEGALVREVIACMPNLNWLCMDSCKVSNEAMAAIRDDFPQVEVVWRVNFGWVYSVRTDVERILASKTSWGGEMSSADVAVLQYCTKVRYLDLGHNLRIKDISFVRHMPELEVFILAMNDIEDISPLADCPKLEYLELFATQVSDLSPLSELKNLRHLNVSTCAQLTDITPLYGLELERLWLGRVTPVPHEQVEEYRRLHPDCEVNDEAGDGSNGTWRYLDPYYAGAGLAPRYVLLREQFGYNGENSPYSVYWLDPNY